jgi:phage terminase large subunit-like protein
MSAVLEPHVRTQADRVVDFFPQYLRHTHDPLAGDPFCLEPFQEEFIRALFEQQEDGTRLYKQAVYAIPRKNGKSSMMAGLAIYMLIFDQMVSSPQVFIAAASRDQANETFEYVCAFVRENPVLAKHLRVVKARKEIHCAKNSLYASQSFRKGGAGSCRPAIILLLPRSPQTHTI